MIESGDYVFSGLALSSQPNHGTEIKDKITTRIYSCSIPNNGIDSESARPSSEDRRSANHQMYCWYRVGIADW